MTEIRELDCLDLYSDALFMTWNSLSELLIFIKTKRVDMRCFFPEELLALSRHAGWSVAKRFGDYDESPLTSNSPKLLLVCRHVGSAPSCST